MLWLLLALASAHDDITRQIVAEVAVRQLDRPDAEWQPAQRDCAGLVRYVLRTAFRKIGRTPKEAPLFLDDQGRPSAFADAETLVMKNFVSLGRGDRAMHALRSGDILAYRTAYDGDDVWHVMLVVVPAPGTAARLIYHPGTPDAPLRTGTLESLKTQAPLEWRPVEQNPAFLGAFRFRLFASDGDTP